MKKIIKNNIFGFVIGAFLFGVTGVYAAYRYYASDVGYTTSRNTDVENVQTAIDDLYKKVIYNAYYPKDIEWELKTNGDKFADFSTQIVANDSRLYFSWLPAAGYSGWGAYFGTKQGIDVTNYKTLHMILKTPLQHSNNSGSESLSYCVANDNDSICGSIVTEQLALNTIQKVNLDISSINGVSNIIFRLYYTDVEVLNIYFD